MDPVTHTLLGVTAGYALFRKKAGPGAIPIMVLASNLPDLDGAVHLSGQLDAVLMRRTFGHSLLLVPLWAAALAWICGLKWRDLTFGRLFGMCLTGAGLHIFFDLINSFGVVMFWPLSNWRPELAIVFIVDFMLMAILLAPLAAAWVRASLRPKLISMARWSLALVGAYLLCCGTGRALAQRSLSQVASTYSPPPAFSYVFPEPLGPHRWRGVLREKGSWSVYLANSITGRAGLADIILTSDGDPRVEAARRTEKGRRLERFFKAPVWQVEPDGSVKAWDLRFMTLIARREPVFVFEFPTAQAGRASARQGS